MLGIPQECSPEVISIRLGPGPGKRTVSPHIGSTAHIAPREPLTSESRRTRFAGSVTDSYARTQDDIGSGLPWTCVQTQIIRRIHLNLTTKGFGQTHVPFEGAGRAAKLVMRDVRAGASESSPRPGPLAGTMVAGRSERDSGESVDSVDPTPIHLRPARPTRGRDAAHPSDSRVRGCGTVPDCRSEQSFAAAARWSPAAPPGRAAQRLHDSTGLIASRRETRVTGPGGEFDGEGGEGGRFGGTEIWPPNGLAVLTAVSPAGGGSGSRAGSTRPARRGSGLGSGVGAALHARRSRRVAKAARRCGEQHCAARAAHAGPPQSPPETRTLAGGR